jgi:hypothetical protein
MPVHAKKRLNPGVTFLTALAALLASSGPAARQQAPNPAPSTQQLQVFRAGADVVPVYATVRDPRSGFVLDLTQDDFELYDEGRAQKITQFTIAAQPLSAVVLLDGSSSMMAEFNRAIEGARNFVLRMLPEDRARIGSFADRVVLGPRFTSNRDELLAYLDDQFNLRVGGETHLWEGLLESALSLNREEGKRAIVVMSDGYNFVVPEQCKAQQPGGSSGGYPPVGGRGPAWPPAGPGRNPVGGRPLPGPPPMGRPGTSGPPPMTMGCLQDPTTYGVTMGQVDAAASAQNVVVVGLTMWTRQGTSSERPNRNLERVALDTGGAFYEVGLNEDLNRLFTDVVQQLRQQYVLGFVPASFDGKRHSLTVKVKRPGLQVQSRRFYIAERAK